MDGTRTCERCGKEPTLRGARIRCRKCKRLVHRCCARDVSGSSRGGAQTAKCVDCVRYPVVRPDGTTIYVNLPEDE